MFLNKVNSKLFGALVKLVEMQGLRPDFWLEKRP